MIGLGGASQNMASKGPPNVLDMKLLAGPRPKTAGPRISVFSKTRPVSRSVSLTSNAARTTVRPSAVISVWAIALFKRNHGAGTRASE